MQIPKPRDRRYMNSRTEMIDKIFNNFTQKIQHLDSAKRIKALDTWENRDFGYPKALTGSEKRNLRAKVLNEIMKTKNKKTS